MRILRASTIKKLIEYLSLSKNESCIDRLSQEQLNLLKEHGSEKSKIEDISIMLNNALGEIEVTKMISRMTSYYDREKFSKINITVHGDTKKLIDRKLKTLGYDSVDELLNDALVDFHR